MAVKVLVDAAVLASVVAALALTPRALARLPDPVRGAGRSVSPLVALALVTGLIYVNQALFTVYVLRVHDGDVSFIAPYMPAGWFDLATHNPVLRLLARDFPAPELLAPSVLRVQAFLELPFVLLAFATVARWLDPGLYRRIARSALLPLASVSYTIVFCVVEWDLRNPYTADDIAIRAVSAVLTPLLIARMAAHDSADARPLTAVRLLLFIGSLGALGVLVLVVYDTALLYNLGRLPERTPLALAGVGALGVLRPAAARLPAHLPGPGPAVTLVGQAVYRWLALFFVPALAIRYGVTFGTPALAAGAGSLTLAVAGLYALRDASTVQDPRPYRRAFRLVAQLGGASLVGAGAAYMVARWASGSYYEATLLLASAAFLVAAITACRLLDAGSRHRASSPSRPLGDRHTHGTSADRNCTPPQGRNPGGFDSSDSMGDGPVGGRLPRGES
ncbi:hypothetical protein [Streptomyces sp. R41]|uniref:Polysaccharide biosynthesis protein n=1 Tax=Streptomyces sp. R41 TaxID=3238632 RepID=A0AB39RNS3_9ACTN